MLFPDSSQNTNPAKMSKVSKVSKLPKHLDTENRNIASFEPLVKPDELKSQLPITDSIATLVKNTRREIHDIIHKKSDKLLFIVGPCSVHDIDQAFNYGRRLKHIAEKVKDKILIVMRVYFEKPRTTVGWKGLINDPYLNNTFDVNEGLKRARQLLLNLNKIGMPCGYEVLDTITPQYISDLMSWGAIGARTTESQVHRQMVSGLSMPVGFKNGTDGNKTIARDAILSAKYPHCFMGITDTGEPSICKTRGNHDCHVILRGGTNSPNFYPRDIIEMSNLLNEKSLVQSIMVDCSHGNSKKDFKNQPEVLSAVIDQIIGFKLTPDPAYPAPIIGVMLESNIYEGKQKLDPLNPSVLEYGVSITDSCISIDKTAEILIHAFVRLKAN